MTNREDLIERHALLIERAKAKGTEEQYLEWLRRWPSALSQTYSEWVDGEGRCEAAHVRMVKLGSGMAHKPEYFAIPLTGAEHKAQHQQGQSIFADDEWYEQQAIEYLVKWINGVQPPMPEEHKNVAKRTYRVTQAGYFRAFYLMAAPFFSANPDKALKVTIEPASKKRTNRQNRAMWSGAINGALTEHYKANKEAFYRDALAALDMQWQAGRINKEFVHDICKWLHNGGESTAKLTTEGMSAYWGEIREHVATCDGVELPELITYEGEG